MCHILSRHPFPDDERSIIATWRSPNAHRLGGYYSEWCRRFPCRITYIPKNSSTLICNIFFLLTGKAWWQNE